MCEKDVHYVHLSCPFAINRHLKYRFKCTLQRLKYWFKITCKYKLHSNRRYLIPMESLERRYSVMASKFLESNRDNSCLRTLRVSLGEVVKWGKLTLSSTLSLPFLPFPPLSNRPWVFFDGWGFITLFMYFDEDWFLQDCCFNFHYERQSVLRYWLKEIQWVKMSKKVAKPW